MFHEKTSGSENKVRTAHICMSISLNSRADAVPWPLRIDTVGHGLPIVREQHKIISAIMRHQVVAACASSLSA